MIKRKEKKRKPKEICNKTSESLTDVELKYLIKFVIDGQKQLEMKDGKITFRTIYNRTKDFDNSDIFVMLVRAYIEDNLENYMDCKKKILKLKK